MKSMTPVLSAPRLRGVTFSVPSFSFFLFFFLRGLKNAEQQDMSNNNTAACLCTVRNRVNDDPKALLITVTADVFSLEKKTKP